MLKKKIIVIGKGSAGKKHFKVIKKIRKETIVKIIKSRKFFNLVEFKKIVKFNPDFFIIASPSSEHYKQLCLIEKNFSKKIILVEKPLFNKYYLKKFKKNKIFVGYNLRMHPILIYLKKILSNKKVYYVSITSSSYLPNWRKGNNYKNSVSAKKNLGGGALLELSHEIDYALWLFGEFKILNSFKGKISNLKIDADDIVKINGLTQKNVLINISLNFFSKILKREIIIEGEKVSIKADLNQNKLEIFNKTKKVIFFKNFKIQKTYMEQQKKILNKNYNNLCTFQEGLKTMGIISKVKSL